MPERAIGGVGPGPSAGTGMGSDDSNLWRSLLQEAAAARPPRLPNGTVLFLGDPAAGKTRLVQRFCGAATGALEEEEPAEEWTEGAEPDDEGGGFVPRENHGRPLLSYSFFDAVDPGEGDGAATTTKTQGANKGAGGDGDEATAARVNVWSLSDPAYRELLGEVLRGSTAAAPSNSSGGETEAGVGEGAADDAWQALSRTVCLIGLDLTRPWTFERALGRWVRVLRGAVVRAALQAATAAAGGGGDADVEEAAEEGLERLRARQAAYLTKCYTGTSTSTSSSEDSQEGADVFSIRAGTTPLKASSAKGSRESAASDALPEGVLEANLGVPLIVVGLKADLVKTDSFEAEQRSQHAQRFLRSFCLRHGAALVYASAAADSNRRLLQRYLLHRMYPEAFPFSLKAQARKEALFVPAGWDSAAVINALVSPNAPWPADAPYGEVMVPPKAERGRWDPFPDDNDAGPQQEQEEGGVRMQALVQPDGEWLEGLARHVEQQLGAAAAASAGNANLQEEGAAPPTRSSARRKEQTATAVASAGAGAGPAAGGGGVRSFFEGLLSTPAPAPAPKK